MNILIFIVFFACALCFSVLDIVRGAIPRLYSFAVAVFLVFLTIIKAIHDCFFFSTIDGGGLKAIFFLFIHPFLAIILALVIFGAVRIVLGEKMGVADVWFSSFIALVFGVRGFFISSLLACVLGLFWIMLSFVLKRNKDKKSIPFIPFMSIGSLAFFLLENFFS